MTQPTKADLTAAVAKLTEENAGLRDLLGAVCVMADAPKPATYSDPYHWECTDRLGFIAVWAELDEGASGPSAAAVIRECASVLREKAAKPVRYEVRAEPATAAANAPRHAILTDEKVCTGADWQDDDSGYSCTAQDGHDGPDHVAFRPGGGEYHRWPAAAKPALHVIGDGAFRVETGASA